MMANREFLMLAKVFNPTKDSIGGWFMSIKRDGQRAFWDGGVSRGDLKANVPWANTEKDSRYVDEQYCTGLWSRYGNVIHAPDTFLDQLPQGLPLDGELYLDRGQFQQTRKIVSTLTPGPGWDNICFLVFEMPSPTLIFQEGRINNPNFKKQIVMADCFDYLTAKKGPVSSACSQFQLTSAKLYDLVAGKQWEPMWQFQLPYNEEKARKKLYDELFKETEQQGEGLMLRHPDSFYTVKRSKFLLKVKPMLDAEATVIGYTWGEGKLEGMMGAMIIKYDRKTFQLSGFTDEERRFKIDVETVPLGYKAGFGEPVCKGVHSILFPRGSKVSFRYTSLTDDGIPREARYWRK